MLQVGDECSSVVSLQCGGKALQAVEVCCGLLSRSGQGGTQLLKEVLKCVAQVSVCFQDGRRDRVWVILAAFELLSPLAGLTRCWCCHGPRLCACSCGRGDHEVEVVSVVGGVEGDVTTVECGVGDGVVKWCVGHGSGVVRWHVDDLFKEWFVSGHVSDDGRELISQGVVASTSEGPEAAAQGVVTVLVVVGVARFVT